MNGFQYLEITPQALIGPLLRTSLIHCCVKNAFAPQFNTLLSNKRSLVHTLDVNTKFRSFNMACANQYSFLLGGEGIKQLLVYLILHLLK
jgi:hypothetical protein